jgi:hypothetical protein
VTLAETMLGGLVQCDPMTARCELTWLGGAVLVVAALAAAWAIGVSMANRLMYDALRSIRPNADRAPANRNAVEPVGPDAQYGSGEADRE